MPRSARRFFDTRTPAQAVLTPAVDLADLALSAALEIRGAQRTKAATFTTLPKLVEFLDARVAGPAKSSEGMRHADHSTLYLIGTAIKKGAASDSQKLRRSLKKADELTKGMRAMIEGTRPKSAQAVRMRSFCLELAQVVMDERNQPFAAFDHGFHHR